MFRQSRQTADSRLEGDPASPAVSAENDPLRHFELQFHKLAATHASLTRAIQTTGRVMD